MQFLVDLGIRSGDAHAGLEYERKRLQRSELMRDS